MLAETINLDDHVADVDRHVESYDWSAIARDLDAHGLSLIHI